MTALAFRFDREQHEYIDELTGQVYPHITGMLERTGWIDDTWFTEESCERGRAVHALTADYDLGAIEQLASVASTYKGWLLAHVKARSMLDPMGLEILEVEEPHVHAGYRFGGRPDRLVNLLKLRGVLEIKSGAPHKAHPIQTALQAILVADEQRIPATALGRWCLYEYGNGRFKLEQHTNPRDFAEATRVIRQCCR